MRYEDWDILLFPRDCKVPLKEFKVACHVVHDSELSLVHGNHGMPTVCCFVPSLAPGAPYKLSIHSWSTPPISQFTRAYGKYADRVVFEARLFVDGQLISSSSMSRAGPWPNVLKNSFEISENGELDSLNFPNFQRELLNQSYWSPADDLGRIKVVISECYPRDSLSMPLERIKNVIAFSFQHAPLDILESSGIAWPNASMWRSMPFTASVLPTRQLEAGGSHAHSPRPRYPGFPASSSLAQAMASANSLSQAMKHRADPKQPTFNFQEALPASTLAGSDPFVEANAYFEWLSGIGMGLNGDSTLNVNPNGASRVGRKSSTDTSMPDYVSSNQTPPLGEHIIASFSGKNDEEADMAHMKVPTNTPTTCELDATQVEGVPFPVLPGNSPLPMGLEESISNSFLSQSTATPPSLVPTPAMEVKSRKENKTREVAISPSAHATVSIDGETVIVRKVSQQLYKPSGSSIPTTIVPSHISPQQCNSIKSGVEKSVKRLRNFTPTSSKAFEDDEEPGRASPRVRLSALEEKASI